MTPQQMGKLVEEVRALSKLGWEPRAIAQEYARLPLSVKMVELILRGRWDPVACILVEDVQDPVGRERMKPEPPKLPQVRRLGGLGYVADSPRQQKPKLPDLSKPARRRFLFSPETRDER